MRDEKATEAKQFVEAIAVMDILSQANCKMPVFLHINLKLDDAKSRDKYFDLFARTVKVFAEKQNELSNGRAIVAVLTTDELQSLKRSRRATLEGEKETTKVKFTIFPAFSQFQC